MPNTFGSLLKKLRLRAGFGLRRFSEMLDMAPSNLSSIENGRRSPPADEGRLREIAGALGLSEESNDWTTFFDAARRADSLPADVQKVANRKLVPALLRTVDNCNLTDTQMKNLIEEIQTRYGG